MTLERRTAVLVGALFLVTTAAFFVSDALITPLLEEPDYVARVGEEPRLVVAAALLALVCGVGVVGIAALLFGVLKRYNEPVALAYLGIRSAELAVIAVYVLGPLLLLSLNDGLAEDRLAAEPVGAVLVGLREWSVQFVYVLNGVAGLLLSFALLRTRLVPRSLAILGLVGYPVLLAGATLDLLGHIDIVSGAGVIAFVPGGLFELLLPLWLFAKGFASSGDRRPPERESPEQRSTPQVLAGGASR